MTWMPLVAYSHEAVMIFFVLSGFIIYYSTENRTTSWRQYAVARLSRIYSVAFPAVIFCSLLAFLLTLRADFDPDGLSNFNQPSFFVAVSSLLFLNESWLNGVILPLNGPYWSLCYEVWFYVIFGCYYFARGKIRIFLVAIASLIAGPAILVLLPVWLMGALLAASGKYNSELSTKLAWLAFLGPLVIISIISTSAVDQTIKTLLHENVPGFWRLSSSQRFFTDYLIGLALCIHISAFSSLPAAVQSFFVRSKSLFYVLAGFSFTLYLFHRPMSQLLGAYLPTSSINPFMVLSLAIGIILACWLLSWGTEKRLSDWRKMFSFLMLPRKS